MKNKINSSKNRELLFLGFYEFPTWSFVVAFIITAMATGPFEYNPILKIVLRTSCVVFAATVVLVFFWEASGRKIIAAKRAKRILAGLMEIKNLADLPERKNEDPFIRKIGQISGEMGVRDTIYALQDGKKIIPLRIHIRVLGKLEKYPIISLILSEVGSDLRLIESSRDHYTLYHYSIFSDPMFHGYQFESQDEYERIISKISELLLTQIFFSKFSSEAYPICVDVCYKALSNQSGEDFNKVKFNEINNQILLQKRPFLGFNSQIIASDIIFDEIAKYKKYNWSFLPWTLESKIKSAYKKYQKDPLILDKLSFQESSFLRGCFFDIENSKKVKEQFCDWLKNYSSLLEGSLSLEDLYLRWKSYGIEKEGTQYLVKKNHKLLKDFMKRRDGAREDINLLAQERLKKLLTLGEIA
jgi:hypothetical protein